MLYPGRTSGPPTGLEALVAQSRILSVIAPLLDDSRADYEDVVAELAAAPD